MTPWYSQLKQLGPVFAQSSDALVDRRAVAELVRREQMWKRDRVRERKNALRVGLNNNGLQKYFRCQNSL
jgi:hypothetical protein